MNNLEKQLLPIAQKWAGNIPIWEAKKQGIDPSAIRHWAHNNPNVEHYERGVYTWYNDDDNIDWENSSIARAIATAGPNAYLWGPSVLELMEIGEVGGYDTYISVPTRRRPKENVRWIVETPTQTDTYHNLPIQALQDAITETMPLLDEKKRCSVIDRVRNTYPEMNDFITRTAYEYGLQ